MSTGYTDKINEGISFNDFVWGCARGMGALVTMRDSMNEPIPDKFKPSDYHKKKITETEDQIARLSKLTVREADVEAEKEYRKEVEAKKGWIAERNELRAKYNAMLEQVNDWAPPSEDHIHFKEFMIQQITRSIDFDCDTKYTIQSMPTLLTGEQYISQKQARLFRDLNYHIREDQEEEARVDGRNRWLRQLRESLKESPCAPTSQGEEIT